MSDATPKRDPKKLIGAALFIAAFALLIWGTNWQTALGLTVFFVAFSRR